MSPRHSQWKIYVLTAIAVFFAVGLYHQYRDGAGPGGRCGPAELTVTSVFVPEAAPGLDACLSLCHDGGDDYSHMVIYRLPGDAGRENPLYRGFQERRPFGRVLRYTDGCGLFAERGKPLRLSPRGNNLVLVDARKVYVVYLPEDCSVGACRDLAAPDGFSREVFRKRILAEIRRQSQFTDWGGAPDNPPAAP